MRRYKPICTRCGEVYSAKSLQAGFHLCPVCRTETPKAHRDNPNYRNWYNDKHVLKWAQEQML